MEPALSEKLKSLIDLLFHPNYEDGFSAIRWHPLNSSIIVAFTTTMISTSQLRAFRRQTSPRTGLSIIIINLG
jgi:hypothetical protein